MNKEQFLAALRARLTGLPREDLERTLDAARDYFRKDYRGDD